MPREFSLAEFAAFAAELVIEQEHAEHEALNEAARLVQREAQAEIGHYQDQAGPFAAWAELADSTKDDRVKQGYPENEPLLREGAMRDSIERTVRGNEAHVGSDSPIAEYQELGTERIPPRSFLGGAAFRKADEVAEVCGKHVYLALTGQGVHGGSLPVVGSEAE